MVVDLLVGEWLRDDWDVGVSIGNARGSIERLYY